MTALYCSYFMKNTDEYCQVSVYQLVKIILKSYTKLLISKNAFKIA